jgi:hypothetical protein
MSEYLNIFILPTSTFPTLCTENNIGSTHVNDALTYIYVCVCVCVCVCVSLVLSLIKLNILTSPQKTHNFTSTRKSITCFYNFS